jgi:DNA repair protein RAD5
MEITNGVFQINSKNYLNLPPTDIDVIGIGMNNNIIFKYKLGNDILYHEYNVRNHQLYLFFEIINNSPLWAIEYKIVPYNGNMMGYFTITFTINVDPNMINDYVGTSMALNFIIADKYQQSPRFTDTDLNNKSIVPYYEPVVPPKTFKLSLYEYQQKTLAKMLKIENNAADFSIKYTYDIDMKGANIVFDPVSNTYIDKHHNFKIKTKGGVLSDEMGLGKTISSIALIASNPAPQGANLPNTKYSDIYKCDKICSKATLVVCPSHLAKQWQGEIKRCDPNLKTKMILTKTDYNSITFADFMDNDILITTHQFIMNFKFYPTLYYQSCTATSFSYDARNMSVKAYLQDQIPKVGFPKIRELENPIFEFFYFQRLILDEGHEIFGEMMGSASASHYMARWVTNIDANYFWYVSGTPFVNFTGVINCARFIGLQLEDKERALTINYNDGPRSTRFLDNIMNRQYIWNQIIDLICVRHRKIDVENQIKIPGYKESLVWLRFTDMERQLYDAKKGKVSNQYLQQLCCHPLVVESAKKIFGDVEIDLAMMQDKLIEYHKSNYETYKIKLTKLDMNNQAYHMLKKSYETQMSESKYLYTILEKMKNPQSLDEENCSICMDCLDNPTLTACGHLFCYDCIKMCLGDKKRCPMCKTDLTGKDLMVMNMRVTSTEAINPLIQKYGSKLGKLISIIRHLAAQEDTRIIIFSQWDDMLNLVGKTLAENEIENSFVKGNVWARNSAINKFKSGKDSDGNDNKVIMLSLKNAASGTNLTEATHIFFVEPIDAPREESKAFEGQAIARACRVGQKQKIRLMRILIANSIEEEIYRKHYNKDVEIDFNDTSYLEALPKEIVETKEEEVKVEVKEEVVKSKAKRTVKAKVKEIEV